jgi:hypothetical protein
MTAISQVPRMRDRSCASLYGAALLRLQKLHVHVAVWRAPDAIKQVPLEAQAHMRAFRFGGRLMQKLHVLHLEAGLFPDATMRAPLVTHRLLIMSGGKRLQKLDDLHPANGRPLMQPCRLSFKSIYGRLG